MLALQPPYRKDIKSLLLLFSVFFIARLLFILLMPHTYSKDLYSWLHVIDLLVAGENPYSKTAVLNWPPFWMQVLYGIHCLSKFIHISVIRLIQMVLIGGEGLAMLLSYYLLKRLHITNPVKPLMIGIALNPICILLSCQHCNFDVFVGFWVLLFVAALMGFYRDHLPVNNWLMACFFLGMGILTKTVPIILSPLLLIGIRKQKATINVFGALLLFTPVLIGMSIIFSLAHEGVLENVIGYRSLSGWYGITGILHLIKMEIAIGWYEKISPIMFLCLMIFVSWRCFKLDFLNPKQIITVVFLLLLFIPTFGPGYSPSYISWFLPLAVIWYAISDNRKKNFLIAGYIIVAITYIIEYAFFNSHGAFITKLIPTAYILSLSDMLGIARCQVMIRIPMFLFYIVLFIVLTKDLYFSLKTGKNNYSYE